MKRRVLWVLSSLLLVGLLTSGSAYSQVSFGIGIHVGPPPVRYERVGSPPFAHAVWVRGYWFWDPGLDRYVWCSGRWTDARPGYAWHDGWWGHSRRGWAWREGWWERAHDGRRDYHERSEWRHDSDRRGHGDHDRRFGHGR